MGYRQVVKVRGFDPRIRWFESSYPSIFALVVEAVDTSDLESDAVSMQVRVVSGAFRLEVQPRLVRSPSLMKKTGSFALK